MPGASIWLATAFSHEVVGVNVFEFDHCKDVVFQFRYHCIALGLGTHTPHIVDLVAVCFFSPFVVNLCPKYPWRGDLLGRKGISDSVFWGAGFPLSIFNMKAF